MDRGKDYYQNKLKHLQQLEREDRKDDVKKQIKKGECSITPLPVVATQPFRSDLTLERHPLFVVNGYKENFFIHEREVKHPDSGEVIVQRVMVGKLTKESKQSYGVLKQVHQEIFYKLLKLWGELGYPLEGKNGVIETTVYQIVMYLKGHDTAPLYNRVRHLLRDLSSIPITLENAYTWQGVHDLDEFTLVEGVIWNGRKLDKATMLPKPGKESKVRIKISETITSGFLHKEMKQILWRPYSELGGQGKGRRAEVARLLYPLLDYELSSKKSYHIALKALFRRLGMKSHQYRSKRREKLLPALNQLQGKPILAEKYKLDLTLRASSDGQDYILVASRVT